MRLSEICIFCSCKNNKNLVEIILAEFASESFVGTSVSSLLKHSFHVCVSVFVFVCLRLCVSVCMTVCVFMCQCVCVFVCW